MIVSRASSAWEYRRRFWLAAGLALAVHAGVYFASSPAVFVAAELGKDEAPSVEVELVEQAPEPVAVESVVVPEPMPEPIPEPEPTPGLKPEDIAPKEPEPKPKPEPQRAEKPKPTTPKKPAGNPAPAQKQQAASGAKAAGGKGEGSSKAVVIYSPKPVYPVASRAAKEHGTVVLLIHLDSSGRVTSVSVKSSSGYSRLDRAAQEAARRLKAKPAMRNGQPVEWTFEKSHRFNLAE